MSPQQRRALDFIADYIAKRRIAPSFDEIKEHLGQASKSGASRIVEALISQGHLVRTSGRWRNLALAGQNLRSVPSAELWAELRMRGETTHG